LRVHQRPLDDGAGLTDDGWLGVRTDTPRAVVTGRTA
jgi:hypothetical protein